MHKTKSAVKFFAICILLGVSGGIIGAGFSFLITFVTKLRLSHGWIICLLPVASLSIVFIYQKLGIQGMGTNDVLQSADKENLISAKLPLGIFVTSAISHVLGASVGREGAALQIGGGAATFFAQKFGLTEPQRQILVRAGMSAVFAAVFGTPLTAFLFALEIVYVGVIHLKSVIPCFITAFSGYFTARLLGAHPERFHLSALPSFSLATVFEIFILTVLVAVLCIGFCHLLHHGEKFAKKVIKNSYLRIAIGGAIILAFTVFIGTQDYNGAGIQVIERIFEGDKDPASISFSPEAFLLKLIFTAVCVSAGFKGGEIVPTLFIGATFGALVASFGSLPCEFGAALGMVLLFSGVTNCPLASIALGFELFSGVGFWYFVPSVLLCFVLSGKSSLYSAQKHKYNFL
ncbi:MAG: chloride channel protein [Ruminococcaceae bacterium]|nr:chloride channel protein [Oscillospiraceae bacterium]